MLAVNRRLSTNDAIIASAITAKATSQEWLKVSAAAKPSLWALFTLHMLTVFFYIITGRP